MTEISVECFTAFAEMAWFQRRAELGLLCRAARDHDRRITVESIGATLPGLSYPGARNVVQWCEALGLCDAGGGLTALGDEVAETDEAPVPEQGVYTFWLARHPVIGSRLLEVQRRTHRNDQRFELIEPLANTPDLDTPWPSVLDPRERFLLRDLPCNHGEVGVLCVPTKARCKLRWTLDFEAEHDHWQLEGRVEGPKKLRPIQHEPEHDGLDLWALAEYWGHGPLAAFGHWDAELRQLAVAVEDITEEEQDRFAKTILIDRVDVPGKGSYRGVTIENVPIGPANAPEAQRWAIARLERRLASQRRYRSRSDVRELFVDLCKTTPLEPHHPALPPHERWLDGDLSSREPEVFWNLTAPVDLAPQPPTAELLGELRMGTSLGGGQ
ncbi:MAG: hypothetical protein AB1Z98_20655 [Nannocystaceae bacterium]